MIALDVCCTDRLGGRGNLTPDFREGVRVYQELGEVAIDPNHICKRQLPQAPKEIIRDKQPKHQALVGCQA